MHWACSESGYEKKGPQVRPFFVSARVDQFVPVRQMTGRYFSAMPDTFLHFQTVLPVLKVGENVSDEPVILVFARYGEVDEYLAVILPAATVT